MKYIIIALLIIFSVTSFAGYANAQSSDATKAAEEKSKVAERAKERLDKLNEKRATKSAKVRDKARRRAHVTGTITAISASTVTIETKKGDIKTIFTNEATKFLQIGKEGKSDIKLADLKIEDKIAAVGIAKDENSGVAKFIVKLNKSGQMRHSVFGEVSKLGDNELTVSHIIHKDKPTTVVKITSDTKIKIKGNDAATFTDIKEGDKVAVSGTVDDNGVLTARRVFVIPGKFEGTKPQDATDSATPSSSSN
ncbi:hypothetical protein IID23_02415 [Patescibacteria group bacterium]|nr:hypothetical protein [Patescibacteria group bacterium]